METKIVGWRADREAATCAHINALAARRRPTGVTAIAGAVAAVAFIVAIVLTWPNA